MSEETKNTAPQPQEPETAPETEPVKEAQTAEAPAAEEQDVPQDPKAKKEWFGKKAAKAIRREGMVPCVLCGNGETETFSVDPREIKPLIYTPNSYIVEFDIEGKKEQAVLREAQFHPVREEILHLDFYRIAEGKPVSIAIPVRLTGNAEGVKVGGKLALSARKLVVSALVENLPDEIVVDVTELGVGKTIFVGDLEFENLKFITPATTAVCAVRVTRASRGAAEAAK